MSNPPVSGSDPSRSEAAGRPRSAGTGTDDQKDQKSRAGSGEQSSNQRPNQSSQGSKGTDAEDAVESKGAPSRLID